MKFNIHTIPKEGLHRRVSATGEWFDAQLPEEEHREFSVDDMAIEYRAERIRGNKIAVTGSIRTVLKIECCRCLSKFAYPVETEFRYIYYPAHTESKWEQKPEEDELDYCPFYEDTINLDNAIIEQIVLQVPIKPVCSDGCKGLCPYCGVNRNVTTCNHEGSRKESAFDALKNIKIKKGS